MYAVFNTITGRVECFEGDQTLIEMTQQGIRGDLVVRKFNRALDTMYKLQEWENEQRKRWGLDEVG